MIFQRCLRVSQLILPQLRNVKLFKSTLNIERNLSTTRCLRLCDKLGEDDQKKSSANKSTKSKGINKN